ncbi:MAG: ATP synthase subunit I [Bacilli bacterium]|nr:ATP synthase subunit I [Bacilli bacterium]
MEKKDSFIKTFPLVWIYTIIVAVVFFFVLGKNYSVSFVLGSATSLMAMSMLYKNSIKVLESDKKRATKLATLNYTFRFGFYALVLVISGILPQLEILGTAFGLLSFKIVLYITIFMDKRGEN